MYYYYYDHFLPLSVCAGDIAAAPTPASPRPAGMSCMMYYNYYTLVQCIIITMTTFFLSLSMRGTRQHLLLRPKCQVCPKSCTNISNTHFTVIGFFYYNNIMHTLSPSDLPPLSLTPSPLKTRGEGGGRQGETGAVGGGGSGSGSGSSGSSRPRNKIAIGE